MEPAWWPKGAMVPLRCAYQLRSTDRTHAVVLIMNSSLNTCGGSNIFCAGHRGQHDIRRTHDVAND